MADLGTAERNFRFLVLEVIKQVDSALRLFERSDPSAIHRIQGRDRYIDHLKSIIENNCYAFLRQYGQLDKKSVDMIRATNVIASNLERIADHAASIAKQSGFLSNLGFMQRYGYKQFFDEILYALELIPDAFQARDANAAVRICQAEINLDRWYADKLKRILIELKANQNTEDLITVMFVFLYLERMGDSLLNIGEAILFSRMGERLKFHQYVALRDLVGDETHPQAEGEAGTGRDPIDDPSEVEHTSRERLRGTAGDPIEFQSYWGTRSGSRIGKVSERGPGTHHHEREAIYKKGDRDKLLKEKESIERWNMLVPGLPPAVLAYREQDEDAALLIEFLEGRTFLDIAITGDPSQLDQAIAHVQETLTHIWTQTRDRRPVKPKFIHQIRDRLNDVYQTHPRFRGEYKQIGTLPIPAFHEQLERLAGLDDIFEAPYSVYIHGDFNLDNIIYNASTERVHFIDLHRSRQMDLAQDVSVFLVSAFRIPVFDQRIRDRLNLVAWTFLDFTREFARGNGDDTFEARLAAGLLRSLFTSTRFELDGEFAENMFNRSRFLLDRLVEHKDRPWTEFRLIDEIIVY